MSDNLCNIIVTAVLNKAIATKKNQQKKTKQIHSKLRHSGVTYVTIDKILSKDMFQHIMHLQMSIYVDTKKL